MHKGYIIIEVESLNQMAAPLYQWKWDSVLTKLLLAMKVRCKMRLVGVYEEGYFDYHPPVEWAVRDEDIS